MSSIKYKNLKLFKKFDTYQKDYLLNIFYKLELYIDKNNSSGAQKIKEIFLEYFEKNNDITESNITDKDIKIKLSYPEQNSIKIDD
ncbi:MAG: hypothetical protein P1U46_04620 [Patescibacteria group bacterium]|nr:hypothetical protein [Patescibacteria group bacterium]